MNNNNSTVSELRSVAEGLRTIANSYKASMAKKASVKVASDNTEVKELDPKHVLNFVKFFGA